MRPALGALALSAALLTAAPAMAQEIVHAVSGTVVSVDPAAKTITLNTNDGSDGVFAINSNPHVQLDFDESVRREAIPAASFNKPKDQVVVFFYGNNTVRNVVGIDDLGAGPLVTTTGTVVKFNKHDHVLTLKDGNGKDADFQIGPKAVADTTNGVVPGEKFDPQKGDNLRVIATGGSGNETALFLREQ
jgi:hypothetical protein